MAELLHRFKSLNMTSMLGFLDEEVLVSRLKHKSSLGVQTETHQIIYPPDLAKVLLEMADQQVDGQSTSKQLLLRAVRLQLIQTLSEGLDVDDDHNLEGLLLAMLSEEAGMLHDHLLPKLRLESAHMVQVKPALLLQLSVRFVSANRSEDCACVALSCTNI